MKDAIKNITPKKMEMFIALCQTKSFGKAARMLGISATMVQGSIAIIEKKLEAHLYMHRRKDFILTEEGEVFFEISKKMMNFVDESLCESITTNTSNNQEVINIACTMWDSEYLMPSVLKEFVERHPNVRCEIFSGAEYIGFNDVNIDCVVGPSLKNRSDIDQNIVYEFPLKMFASKEYLSKHGTPKDVDNIKNHNLVIHRADFPISNKIYRNNRISVVSNNYASLFNFVDNDFGMALLPEVLVQQSKEYMKRIIPVAPDFIDKTESIFFLTRKEGRKKELLECLKDLVKKHYDKL